jgi:DNA-binding beta-propeller fold protein YncE
LFVILTVIAAACGSTAASEPEDDSADRGPTPAGYAGPALVVVSSSDPNAMWAFDLAGSQREFQQFGALEALVARPGPLAFDLQGNLYAADLDTNMIYVVSPDGSIRASWGGTGDDDGEFLSVSGIAVDRDGRIFIVDRANHRVQRFDASGNFERAWGSAGDEPGAFQSPAGAAIDSAGNVYIADTGNDRVQKFDPDGAFIAEIGTEGRNNKLLEAPLNVSIDVGDVVYVVDAKSRVATFDTDGRYIGQFGEPGTGSESFGQAVAIVADNCGSIWVADSGHARILKFNTHGYFRMAIDATVDGDGGIWLAGIHESGSCSNDGL